MESIEKVKPSQGLAVYSPGETKAVSLRQRISSMPEVINEMTPVERQMFAASLREPIGEMQDEQLANKVGIIAKYITRDAGIKTIDDYDVTRFMTVLKNYYPLMSLKEIRMAFELSMAGELDDYLSRDKNGNPDKSHYQSFNVEYVTKILNAYKKRRREVSYKAHQLAQIPEENTTPATSYREQWLSTVLNSFYWFKYTGKLPRNANPYRIYQELEKHGLAMPINVTEEDKKEAMNRLLKKASDGLIRDFIATCIRQQQTRHADVISEAYLVAKERALISTFAALEREEIQITNYVK